MDQFDEMEQHLARFGAKLDELRQLLNEIAGSTRRRRALAARHVDLDGARKDFVVRLWALVSEVAELKGQVTEQLLLSRKVQGSTVTSNGDTS